MQEPTIRRALLLQMLSQASGTHGRRLCDLLLSQSSASRTPKDLPDLSRDAGQWSPQLGLREACRSAVQPETRAEAPPVLIVDMVDTPRFIRIIAWLLAPFILMGAALIVWGLRQRSRSAPQTVGFP